MTSSLWPSSLRPTVATSPSRVSTPSRHTIQQSQSTHWGSSWMTMDPTFFSATDDAPSRFLRPERVTAESRASAQSSFSLAALSMNPGRLTAQTTQTSGSVAAGSVRLRRMGEHLSRYLEQQEELAKKVEWPKPLRPWSRVHS
eukprot:GEMP01095238.1.p2 GENE.GEMP01095238.1~~GEMP01095238.1.p2  ORF type:complete len:143 (+),score=30.90 GEMP01095238.1:64-492(+)